MWFSIFKYIYMIAHPFKKTILIIQYRDSGLIKGPPPLVLPYCITPAPAVKGSDPLRNTVINCNWLAEAINTPYPYPWGGSGWSCCGS